MKKRLIAALFAVYLIISVSLPCLATELSDNSAEVVEITANESVETEESSSEQVETSSSLPVPKQKVESSQNEVKKTGFLEKMKKNFYNTFIRIHYCNIIFTYFINHYIMVQTIF